MNDKVLFIKAMLPHAIEAIGKQHGWLVRWAIAKAGVESNWNLSNILIVRANNCLGIKGGAWDAEGHKWAAFKGVDVVWLKANTGPEAGEIIPWRNFPSLEACFGEFVRMLNDRTPYQVFRNAAVVTLENIYTGDLAGHAMAILSTLHDITARMEAEGLCDGKGRITL